MIIVIFSSSLSKNYPGVSGLGASHDEQQQQQQPAL
jgi:hypothetical protein